MRNLIAVAFVCLTAQVLADDSFNYARPVVETEYGKVRGAVQRSSEKRLFYAFKGIPYAAPPVGPLRFKDPIPPEPWNFTREAAYDRPHCTQVDFIFKAGLEVEGQEDCLFINVYTPGIQQTRLLPVLVFIHPGAFVVGNSRSDVLGPKYFLNKDIVLVTFNYRLGAFGFLSTNDDASPGNYGLKDQVLALNWVNKNIGKFGGNKNLVTVSGASAGAGSVHLHMFSPLTKGLFRRAIAQSGSALSVWGRPHNELQEKIAKQQASLVDCDPNEDSYSMIDCLRKVDANTLARTITSFTSYVFEPLVIYGPVIEKQSPTNPKPYLTADPFDLIQKGEFHNVPLVMGVVEDEGILLASPLLRNPKSLDDFNKNFNTVGPRIFALPVSTNATDAASLWKNMSSHFLQADSINVKDSTAVQAIINMFSDRLIHYGAYQSALLHAWKGSSKVWFYKVNYKGENSYERYFAKTTESIDFNWGVCHLDDLLYMFTTPSLFRPLRIRKDLLMRDIMVQMWIDFATQGNPSPQVGLVKWKWNPLPDLSGNTVVKNSDLTFLDISGNYRIGNNAPINFEIRNDFIRDRIFYWESLPLAENIKGIE